MEYAYVKNIQDMLFELQDLKYKEFQCKLIPTVDPNTVIGVRTPALRTLAKTLSNTPEAESFIKSLPHQYYDENNLHGFLLERIKDYSKAVAAVDEFLPYIDNWATCDLMSIKVFKKNLPELLIKIREWLASSHVYTIRFGIEMLMSFYLDGEFRTEYLDMVAELRSDEYYVNMMTAWYFATALAKQYDAALPYIEQRKLDVQTHNKAIQKAVESRRITDEQKSYLRTLKIKVTKA